MFDECYLYDGYLKWQPNCQKGGIDKRTNLIKPNWNILILTPIETVMI